MVGYLIAYLNNIFKMDVFRVLIFISQEYQRCHLS
ncbi:hypothetical protein DFQ50_11253 [Pseudocitrobacter faecalis]|uniref:Uncharacterized protein n=1 Tax=Pseudocitrobacter faecalis TaxID=1398493 RepID=A0ABX9FPH6_9ENTR|nr:hypothetical protein DFQ50_11253 [Pseudocitrobacter faecalis]